VPQKLAPGILLPTFKGGYKLEGNFGEKCQKSGIARYSAGHWSMLATTFLSS
jgi:hypothetical protein